MKPVKRILAVILAAGGAITVAGCSGGSTNTSTATMANWNVATSATVEKNYVDYWRTHKERAVYKISFKEGGNSSYSVSYDTVAATYATSFYMDKEDYDWTAAALPEGVKITEEDATATADCVYVYETELSLKGYYKLGSDGSATVKFEDSIITVCKYRLAGESLKPVYSKHIIKSTSPATLNAVTVDGMSVKTDAVYETYYNRDCNKAVIKITDNLYGEKSGEKSVSLDGLTFDNFQLEAALRAFNLSGTKTFSVCSPQDGKAQSCTAFCTDSAELSSETDGSIITALKNVKDNDGYPVSDYIFFDGTSTDADAKDKQIRYNAVSLAVNADMRGSSPVYWYAALENADANATRCVLLKKNVPLSFGLGTLTYSLDALYLYNI